MTSNSLASTATTIRFRTRNQLTIPQAMTDALELEAGDLLTAMRIGDAIVLAPRDLKTPKLAEDFSSIMDEEGVSLADLLDGLTEERSKLYDELYG